MKILSGINSYILIGNTMNKTFARSISILLFIIIALVGITACQTPPEPTPTFIPADTVAPTETPTPSPTVTQTITPTATATITSTATATFTPSPTPFLGFEESHLNSHQSQGELYLFIFNVPGVSQPYYATIKNYPFECSLDENYPDLLLCLGDPFESSDEYVHVIFFEDPDQSLIVYENDYHSGPVQYTPFAIMGDPTTWCPQRGENVVCETEYRMYNNEECIVSSCFDACGYYYSVDTCPNVPLSEFIFLPPPDER